MSFIHPLMLGGVALIALPIVLHLLMRQQPKHFLFPAVRFIQRQVKTNQRKLRLRHLLLLLLRILLVALMCLALARPRLFSDRLTLGGDQAAAVVLIVDTSATTEYNVAGQSRLDAAKERAGELLDEISEQGRVAVLDTAEPTAEWQPNVRAARERIAALKLRPGNQPVTTALAVAYRLFQQLAKEETEGDTLPRFVYVLSDHTPNSWDNGRVKELIELRDALPDPKAKGVYIDVGVDEPADVAVSDLRMKQLVPRNRPAALEVSVLRTGPKVESELMCRFDGNPDGERKPLTLQPGQSAVVGFEKRDLAPGWHTVEVRLLTDDSLPINNVRYATFQVREPRKLLVLTDEVSAARNWKSAIEHQGEYVCDVRAVGDAFVRGLTPDDIANGYKAVFLFEVARPSASLWQVLEAYVNRGGAIGVVPGGEEVGRDEYNVPESARRLMPGQLDAYESSDAGVEFVDYLYSHPMMARYRDYAQQPDSVLVSPRRTYRYWSLKPAEKVNVLLRYADKERRPAILERVPEASNGRGKVVLFTSPLDGGLRKDDRGRGPNDYNDAHPFYFVLANHVARYLAGEAEDAAFTHPVGRPVTVPLPPGRRDAAFVLQGPGLTGADTQVNRPDGATELVLTQPQQPGHYTLMSTDRAWSYAFSLNLPPGECLLVPRIAPEVIEKLFGDGAVVAPGQNRKLRDAMEGTLRQPVELFPWLMILVLVVLAVENLLANRFYRNDAKNESEPRTQAAQRPE